MNLKSNTVTDQSKALSRAKRRWPKIVALVLFVATSALVVFFATRNEDEVASDSAIDQVRFGHLTIGVDGDEGEIKPGDFRLLVNELQGISRINSMVEPGTIVKAGELIIELDASSLKDKEVDQQITVQLAEAAFVRARETLTVVKKVNESKIKTAKLNVKFAEQDIIKYEEGDYPQQLRTAKSAIILSKAEAEDAKQVHEWSIKLFKNNYITQTDLNRDKLSRDRKEIDLQTAEGKLAVLEKYTHKRDLDQLNADVDELKFALIVAEDRALSDSIDASADLQAKVARLKREKEKLQKIQTQIEKSRITAPIDGKVLYIQDRRDGKEGLAVGSTVYERQWLVRLPTTSKLMAELKVHESQLRKIKVGMPVEVNTDAIGNKIFWGKLSKIADRPDSTHRYGNPFLKVFTVEVEFHGDTEGLRSGMSCMGRVIVNQFEDVTYVPIQAVVHENDESVVYMPGPKGPVRREVEIGEDNNIHVVITQGLEQGDQILLAPTLSKSYVQSRKQTRPMPTPLQTDGTRASDKANQKDLTNPGEPTKSRASKTTKATPSIASGTSKP